MCAGPQSGVAQAIATRLPPAGTVTPLRLKALSPASLGTSSTTPSPAALRLSVTVSPLRCTAADGAGNCALPAGAI